MKRFILIILLNIVAMSSFAKTPPAFKNIKISAELESKHIWRGLLSSSTPTFTGDITFSNNSWSSSLWFAQAFNSSYSEIDLNLTYSTKHLSVSLFDYYCPKLNKNNEITDYSSLTTDHSLDFIVEYNLSKKYPFSFLGSVLLYGDDRNPVDLINYYSMYFEVSYNIFSKNNQSIIAKVGITPDKSIYGSKTGIANLQLSGSQILHLSNKIKLPVCAEIIASPTNKSVFINFHIGIL